MFSFKFKLVNVFHLNPCLWLLYIKLSSVFFFHPQFIFHFDFPSYFPLLYSLVICSVPCSFKLIPAISWGCRLIFSLSALPLSLFCSGESVHWASSSPVLLHYLSSLSLLLAPFHLHWNKMLDVLSAFMLAAFSHICWEMAAHIVNFLWFPQASRNWAVLRVPTVWTVIHVLPFGPENVC